MAYRPAPDEEVLNQSPTFADVNLFTSDTALSEAVAREGARFACRPNSRGWRERLESPTLGLASTRDFNNLRFTVRSESTRLPRPARNGRRPGDGQAEAAP